MAISENDNMNLMELIWPIDVMLNGIIQIHVKLSQTRIFNLDRRLKSWTPSSFASNYLSILKQSRPLLRKHSISENFDLNDPVSAIKLFKNIQCVLFMHF